ncbi:MAG TPA: cation-translocating P-type ATPase [Candidatus Scatomorpha intestinavium]|mgnify:FL=1|uniref:P-type Ca(2+) transporter n=1 Tax=Candidatus Scatomorpha intestinavium TaxID=2840922 RepID=A0A9D0ZDF9_9FIRM|nr:cation-translocating P-type ATPase [Candidatus Scatomorpha intestinavium]
MKYYCEDAAEVLRQVDSSSEGLTSGEAAKRLERDGRNELAAEKKDSLIKQFFKQMADPMIIILIVAAAISAATGIYQGEGITDTIIILAVVIVNAVLGVYQENKAEKAIEALQAMSAATSKVLRDGKVTIVPSAELVAGDVVLLEAGDAVPADGRILESASLQIEEAALTGESVPVYKFIDIIDLKDSRDVPLGDRKNMAYMGSTVVYGRGSMVVTDTGMNTEMGKIADALARAEEGQTPLQIKLSQLSKILTWLVLGICVVIFGVQIAYAGGFSGDVILESFMVAVSLAVAAIPEGLAAVVTVVLSIGVTNMSKRNAIIRRLTAVETLGCAQIICSDKTGTLTQNRMTVVDHYGEDEKLLARAMSLCSDAEEDENGAAVGEPTECALVNYAHGLGLGKPALKAAEPRVGEAPFDSMRKMMSTVHKTADGIVQYTKGAPDEVLKLCTGCLENGRVVPMTDAKRAEILAANKAMADRALRVLAASMRKWDAVPEDCSPANLEHDLVFIGLTGMIDPVRPEVKAAIEECRGAGIRPIMITGDHIDTAVAIAKELGILDGETKAITGSQLDAMSDEEFEREFRNISVYARVQPEHKTRIVNAWRGAGCVTAMTGDGVNDAPSIKSADIGVGMGITGTDVTKNVADMVLADDNFATIVGAVEEGRRIYDNIRKAIQFLLGSNMSEVISIFVATLMGFTILQPVHLLWINLVTDCFPALALGMEKAEADIMKRRPRDAKAGVFAGGMGFDIAYQGLVVSALTLASYFIGHYIESGVWTITDSADGTTMAFVTMSMAEIFHSFNMRSQRGSLLTLKGFNKTLNWAALGSLVATTLVCEVPFLANAFGFTSVELNEYLIALALAFCIIPIVEIVKFFQRKAARK